jgi:hypothetical protein
MRVDEVGIPGFMGLAIVASPIGCTSANTGLPAPVGLRPPFAQPLARHAVC